MIPRDLLRRPRRCGRALSLCKQKSEPSDFSYLDLNRPGLIVATSDQFNSGDMHHHILCSSTTGSEISIRSVDLENLTIPTSVRYQLIDPQRTQSNHIVKT
ncbi:hypothetical protein AAC387_Pa06g3097 [Persea americana]